MGVAYFDKSLSHSDLEGKAHQVIRNNIINMTKKKLKSGTTMVDADKGHMNNDVTRAAPEQTAQSQW